MTPLEMAILNLMELAAVEDAPPFARLLRPRAGAPSGTNVDPAMVRSPERRRDPEDNALTIGQG